MSIGIDFVSIIDFNLKQGFVFNINQTKINFKKSIHSKSIFVIVLSNTHLFRYNLQTIIPQTKNQPKQLQSKKKKKKAPQKSYYQAKLKSEIDFDKFGDAIGIDFV